MFPGPSSATGQTPLSPALFWGFVVSGLCLSNGNFWWTRLYIVDERLHPAAYTDFTAATFQNSCIDDSILCQAFDELSIAQTKPWHGMR